MPPTFEGPEVTGVVSAEAATATGLAAGTPVVAGGGDQSANAVGVGAVDPGIVALSLGTSGVVFASTDRPIHDPLGQVHAFCHALPDRWHLMTVMLSAAGSLRWFRDALAPGVDFGALSEEAGSVSAGADGLLFLPYLTGERSPHPDPLARGAFVGLSIGHERRHLTRAVLEGVAFGLRDGLDEMIAAGMPAPGQIRASGGGTASPVWRQILADVLDAEIATVSTTEGAAFGAALLGAVGAGWYGAVQDATAALVHASPRSQRLASIVPPTPAPTTATASCTRHWRRRSAGAERVASRLPLELEGGALVLGDLVGLLAEDDHAQDVIGRDVALVDGIDDPAVVHDADPIRQVEDVVDVVADQEDADALVLELADQVAHLRRLRRARAQRSARP